jgi:hypothetical protein
MERVCANRVRAFLHQRFGVHRGDTAHGLPREQSWNFGSKHLDRLFGVLGDTEGDIESEQMQTFIVRP